MAIKEIFYGKDAIRFSVKNGTQDMSLIRVRVNINGDRLTYYLPIDYKICPKHWDTGKFLEYYKCSYYQSRYYRCRVDSRSYNSWRFMSTNESYLFRSI